MRTTLQSLYCGLTFLLIAATGAATVAQTSPARPPSDELLAEVIQTRLKQLQHAQGLDDVTRKSLQTIYEDAQKSFQTVKEWTDKTTEFAQMALHGPSLLEQTKAELVAQPAERTLAVPAEATVKELEQTIVNRESELAKKRLELEKLEGEPKRRADERESNTERLAKLRQALSRLNAELQTPSDERDPLATAERTRVWAQRRAVEQELLARDRQAAAYEATADVLPVQRDLTARQIALAEQEIKQLQELVNQRRQQEAERQAQAAKLGALQAHPAVRRLAEENAGMAEVRTGIAQRITQITAQLEQTNQQLTLVKEQFKRAKEKVDAVGLTNAIGLLLRKQRDALPHVGHRRRSISERQLLIGESQLTLLQLRDRRSEVADIETRTRGVMQELAGTPGLDREHLETLVRGTLQNQKEYLDALIGDHNAYFEKLVDLDNAERRLVEEAEQCARFIDERVLWITSDAAIEPGDARHAGDALWWLAGPEAWAEIGRALLNDALLHPALPVFAALVFLPLIFFRSSLRDRLEEIGGRTKKANCYRFAPTMHALLLTLLLAAIWPGVLGYCGWRLAAPLDASELCKAVGTGLLVAARVLFVVQSLRLLCQSDGLAEAHFGWSEAAVKVLRANTAWLRLPLPPAIFVIAAMDSQANDRWDGALGRAGFIAALVLCAVFLQRILRPQGGVFQNVLAERRDGWLDRLRYVWYPAGTLLPVVFALLAAVGYYYTSQQLSYRLALTAYLVCAFVLLRSLLLRWILVSRRKLAIDQARQRRAQAEAAGEESASCELPAAVTPDRDLAAINTQTRRLVEYTLIVTGALMAWMVWVDVTPALRFLNEVEVWRTPAVTESVKGPDNTITTKVLEPANPVTLASLLLALVIIGMTVTAAKNIPGLMELAVLQHLPMDAGVRYAVSTVSRYLIVIVGLTFGCGTIGLGWSKVQWLVAAVGVGLGFGLQEIFANFISGLIILFERPIRVGDVITVGEISGKVTRIRMRATTIIDGDRKELIVPNKEFITGRVLNWTLSDQVNRIVINVGVAYGSNTEKVTELLLAAAQNHPAVLDDPAPQVSFQAFGASSLDFVLRCYLAGLDSRTAVIHELHMAIDRAFRAADIEIAFPQQDIHIRSLTVAPPLPAPADERHFRRDDAQSPEPHQPTLDAATVLSRLSGGPTSGPHGKRVA